MKTRSSIVPLFALTAMLIASYFPEACFAQKWRTSARPRTAALQYLTDDTCGILSIHPGTTVAAPWFQQLPKQWQDGYSRLVYHATMIEADPRDIKHMMVMLEPFTKDQITTWTNNGQKPWHGRVAADHRGKYEHRDESIGAPPFVGALVTFSSEEAANKCHDRLKKFGQITKLGDHEVIKGNWGSSPVMVHRNNFEFLVACESRLQRMLDTNNTNPRMAGFVKHVWRPYQEYALFLPESMDRSILDSFANIIPGKRADLKQIVKETGSIRFEFKPSDKLYVDWRALHPEKQAALSERIKDYCDTSSVKIDTSIPPDYINREILQSMGNRLLKNALTNVSINDEQKDGCFMEFVHPRSLEPIVGRLPRFLGYDENRERIATRGQPKSSSKTKSQKRKSEERTRKKSGNRRRVSNRRNRRHALVRPAEPAKESPAFIDFIKSKHWELLNDFRNGVEKSHVNLSIEQATLTASDCRMLAKSKSVQSLWLYDIQVDPDDFQKVLTIPTLDTVWLRGKTFKDDHLKSLQNVAHLDSFALSGTAVTDAGLAYLSRNRSLRVLSIESVKGVSAKGISRMLNQPNLQAFRFANGSLDQACFEKLSRITTLQRLTLRQMSGLTDENLARLNGLTNLRDVSLDFSAKENLVTSQGLLEMTKNHVPDSFRFPNRLLNDDLLASLIKNNWLYGPSNYPGIPKPETAKDVRLLKSNRDQITDKGFELLLDCTNISSLELVESKVTDASLKKMEAFNRIDTIRIWETNVSAAGLTTLKDCPIRSFTFRKNQTTEDLFVFLGQLETLEILNLESSKLDPAWIEHLATSKSLKKITMTKTGLNDAALAELAKIATLESLSIRNNLVTTTGLRKLVGHPSLKTIKAGYGKIGSQELEAFKKEHPKMGLTK